MVELVLTFVVIGILTAMTVPKIARTLQASQVRRAAATVAVDLESAFTLAARRRRPMRLDCNCGQGSYTVVDRTGTVRLSRSLRGDRDLGQMTLTFTPAPVGLPVEIFPSGISDKSLTVVVTSGTSTRTVTMSTVGQVRILP